MLQPIQTDLRKLWETINFDFEKDIPFLRYEYKHLGYDFPELFSTFKNDLALIIENIFYQFMMARFGHLFQFHNQQIIIQSDRVIKQVYNRIFVFLDYGKKQKINTLFVIVAVVVARITEKIFPNVVYNERLTMEIMHCIIFCSLGVMVGDNAVKYLIGKQLGHRQMTRFLLRKMFEQNIIIAKIKQLEEDKQWPELKKLFYQPPPPPPQKIPFDNDPPTIKQQRGFIRSLNTYNIKSIQMSRAFLHQNKQFLVKQNSLKKYPCKMSISLQAASPYYKLIKKPKPHTPIKTQCFQKIQTTTNKKNLKYWQQYISKFKIKTQTISHQKFPPIIPNQQLMIEQSILNNIIQRPKITHQNIQLLKTSKKSFSKLEYFKTENKSHRSFHQVKQPKQTIKVVMPVIKTAHNSKHKSLNKTTKIKNQSKQFYKNRLQIQDEYQEALRKQFHKLNLIR